MDWYFVFVNIALHLKALNFLTSWSVGGFSRRLCCIWLVNRIYINGICHFPFDISDWMRIQNYKSQLVDIKKKIKLPANMFVHCHLSPFWIPDRHSPLRCNTLILVSASNRCGPYIHIHLPYVNFAIYQMWKHTTSSTVTLLLVDLEPFSLEARHNHNAAQNYWCHNRCVRSTILHDSHSECIECLHIQIKVLWNTIFMYQLNAHA